MDALERFILKAKKNGWVGAETGGTKIPASRLGSMDITYQDGDFFYQDTFVGLSDFCGQEHVCFKGEAVWSMVYRGRIMRADLIDGAQVVEILRAALGALYQEGRFLGHFQHKSAEFTYLDTNQGDFNNFSGRETIIRDRVEAYELHYVGGIVRK